MSSFTLAVALAACLTAAPPVPPGDTPPELGAVRWGRDLDAAKGASAKDGTPILLLFQEIPGCRGCVDFGRGPMSHPLLVEAIETLTIPVVVHNNRPGPEEAILKQYEEPAWNYPVARFLDGTGRDLIPRRDRVWTTDGIATRLAESLRAANRDVPGYLSLLGREIAPDARRHATFAMACFWEGEGRLGGIDGVLATRAGWVGGHEVVELEFDPQRLAYPRLVEEALRQRCAEIVFAHDDQQLERARGIAGDAVRSLPAPARDAQPSDRLFALRRTPLIRVPMTPLQATRVNAALRGGGDPMTWLSPRQRELAVALAKLPADGLPADLTPPADPAHWAAYETDLRGRLQSGE